MYRKNFGDKELHEGDIREIDPNIIPEFDMLTAGFPCQDISNAGKREGIKEGNRSGLWFEIVRIIRSRSPRWVFLENVAALTIRGLDIVLRDLSENGYNAQWDIVSAQSIGAPHVRKRIWIIAHTERNSASNSNGSRRRAGDDNRERGQIQEIEIGETSEDKSKRYEWRFGSNENTHVVTNNRSKRIQGIITQPIQRVKEFSWCKDIRRIEDYFNRFDIPQPLIRREDDGFSRRVDRLRCLGNAVVPAVVTHVGRCINDTIDEGII